MSEGQYPPELRTWGSLRADPDFVQMLNDGIAGAVRAYYQKKFSRDAPVEAIEFTTYESDLGAYIIGQNPYAPGESVQMPILPENSVDERRWVRKSGILKDRNALDPHPRYPNAKTIPPGEISLFVYEDPVQLQDTGDYTYKDCPNPDPSVECPTSGPPPDPPAHDKVEIYRHRVVKTVRLKYLVFGRKSPTDKQVSYMKIQYTGSDH